MEASAIGSCWFLFTGCLKKIAQNLAKNKKKKFPDYKNKYNNK